MKQKLLTLFALLLCVCSGAWGATVDDLKTISTDHTIYFADIMSANISSNSLFANDYLFTPNGCNYATNKGTDKDLSKLYCCRVKSDTQDVIAFKVSGACTLVLYADRITDRTPIINDKVAAKTDGDNSISGTDVTGTDGKKGHATYAIPEAGTYYIIGSGDCFLAGLEFTFPGTFYTMTATVDDEAHGTAAPNSASVRENNSVTFTATPNLGWKFTKWTDTTTGDDVSTENPYTIASVTGDVSLTANFEAATTYNVTISAGETGALGKYYDNTVITQNENSTVTLPAKNSWFYKEGYTATGWTDGTNDYEFGGSFTLTGNVSIYPIFRVNTKAIGDADATVTWSLLKPEVGSLHIEGSTGYLVTTAEVAGETIDVPMLWDNTSGKLDNRTRTTDCQVNGGSKFTIPAIKGVEVTLAANYAITATIDGNDMDATTESPFTATGTYTGTADAVEVIINGGAWFQGITAVYKVNYDTPTIEADTKFNFANKGYKVTITASEGDLYVSTNGVDYTAQTSPFEAYATTTTTYYAKATGANYNDSPVASKAVTNNFDPAKNYVAYVYQTGYSDSSVDYDFATDELAIALAADYNVVEVSLAQGDDPTTATDMNNADAIVLTEAVKGSNTATDMSNKMKEYVGNVPMVGMKMFAYTYNSTASKNRWGWGTASNNAGVNAFTPKNTTYKLFDGVTFEANGTIKLATATSGNILQSVDFTTPATPLSPNTIMGTVDGVDTKAVLHTTTKYLGIGISCNVRETYTENLSIIVKNAIEMLLSGEALDATDANISRKVTGTIAASGMCTLASTLPVDLSTLASDEAVTAYYASEASGSTVTLTTTTATVPAGEGLVISGTANKAFTVDVAASGTAIDGNLLKAGDGTTEFDGTTYDYLLFSDGKFYQIGSGTVAVGKAYLHLNAAPSAKALSIVFNDGETTNISNLNVKDNATMYNLSGQKVNNSYKGIVIKNGKKYIIK